MTIITKQFKELYPTYAEFETEVLDKVNVMHPATPAYLDDAKLVYSKNMIFTIMNNRYSEFFARNDDAKQHQLMQNAMQELLPALYLKSLKLSTDALSQLSIDNILSVMETRYNEDPDNKYATTETSYTSTPTGEGAGSFTISKPKDKNIINRKDATRRIKETKNLLERYKVLNDIDGSGLVNAFLNDMTLNSLWLLGNAETVQVLQGEKGEKGDVGPQGQKGDKGDSVIGPQGAQGIQGIKGDKGDKGDQGEKGAKGDTGADGAVGAKGEQGDKGDKGDAGKSFTAKGSVATKADLPVVAELDWAYHVIDENNLYVYDGATWVNMGQFTGQKGEKGDKGDKGDAGAVGAQGVKGDKGDDGAVGAKGEKGDAGAQGPQGAQGPAGTNGVDGAKGDKGDKGDSVHILSPTYLGKQAGFIGVEKVGMTTNVPDGEIRIFDLSKIPTADPAVLPKDDDAVILANSEFGEIERIYFKDPANPATPQDFLQYKELKQLGYLDNKIVLKKFDNDKWLYSGIILNELPQTGGGAWELLNALPAKYEPDKYTYRFEVSNADNFPTPTPQGVWIVNQFNNELTDGFVYSKYNEQGDAVVGLISLAQVQALGIIFKVYRKDI